MKSWKLAFFVAIAAPGVVGLDARPADAGGYALSLNSGAGIPTGDYGDVADVSWNVGAGADYSFNHLWGAGVDLGYHNWEGSDEYNAALAAFAEAFFGASPGTTMDASFRAFQYGAHGTFTPPIVGQVKPYLQAGIAGYSLREEIDSSDPFFSGDFSKSKFGWNVGAGALFSAAPTVSLGVDGHYHWVGAKDDYGVDLSWFTVQGRVVFHIPLAK